MIRSPIGIRLDTIRPIREQIREAARLGAKGVVIEAVGDLAPARLSASGRREFRHILRSVEIDLTALSLPTRRPYDTSEQLEERLRRADSAFEMAYELGTNRILVQPGAVPLETEPVPRSIYLSAIRELGRLADHRGTRVGLEIGPNPGSEIRALLDQIAQQGLAASIDPAGLIQHNHDPIASVIALGPWVAHAYANLPQGGSIQVRRPGFAAGTIDWIEYLGALEEINYRGPLTIWPDPNRETSAQFQALSASLHAF